MHTHASGTKPFCYFPCLQKQQNQIVVIAFVLLPKRRAYVIHNIKAQRESLELQQQQ